MKYLKIMIENVSFIAKQNISFRGHKEKREDLTVLSSINRGNFLELVSLRSKDSGFLHGRLKSYFSKKGFGQWTSSKIQNEMIDLLANFTRKIIIQQILILMLVVLILELFVMKQVILGKPSLKLFT